MTDHRGPLPVPARITDALDQMGAEGPEVDIALGGVEPMVDQWEAGELMPTRDQVELLAAYTGFPVAFFYKPVEEWETQPTRTFMCQMGRRGDNGLTITESWIDWEGVRHLEVLTPPRPPYRPPKPKSDPPAPAPAAARAREGTHRYDEEPGAPGYCRCGMPKANRRVHR